ncbi:hypothetical protein M0813_05360 [Anaeramoeba flamelloides]|uniref:BTB domain-containing protein n=1 Tax=Anaeramoeba flamelloides TaxID=1746091 RepID=A0ABQ8XIR9_9EUKA|nr:hypothetical protein M0813_05360 [Anaeramoeba flamelloides]
MQKSFFSLDHVSTILKLKTVEELKSILVELNPKCVTKEEINPLSLGVTKYLGKDKLLTIFHILCLNPNLTISMLDYLYEWDNDLIKTLSQQKMNPFHYLCLNTHVRLPLIKWFLEGKCSQVTKKINGSQSLLEQKSLIEWNPIHYLCTNKSCKNRLIFKYLLNQTFVARRIYICPFTILKKSRNRRQFVRLSKVFVSIRSPFSVCLDGNESVVHLIIMTDPDLTNKDLQEICKSNPRILPYLRSTVKHNVSHYFVQDLFERSKANLPIPLTLFVQIILFGTNLKPLGPNKLTMALLRNIFESERSIKKQEIMRKVKNETLKKKKLNYLKKLKYPNVYQFHQSLENFKKDLSKRLFKLLEFTHFSHVMFTRNTIREDLEKARLNGTLCDWEIDNKAVAHSLFLRKRFGVNPKILKQKLLESCTKEEIDFFLQEAYLNNDKNKERFNSLLMELEINPKHLKDPEIVVEDLWVEKTQSDFFLIAQGKKIRTHKFILAARSNLFESFFQISGTNTKSLTDQSKCCIQSLHVFTRFLYTGHLLIDFNEKISNQVLKELQNLSEYYQLNLNSPYEKLLKFQESRLKKKFKNPKVQKIENNNANNSLVEKKFNKQNKEKKLNEKRKKKGLGMDSGGSRGGGRGRGRGRRRSRGRGKKKEEEKEIRKEISTKNNPNNEKKSETEIKKRIRGRGRGRGRGKMIKRVMSRRRRRRMKK